MARGKVVINMPKRMDLIMGIVVLAAGAALLTMDAWLETGGMPELEPAKWGAGSLFALAGLALLLHRRRAIVDADQRVVIQQSSVGFPFKETREPFGADARVSVTQDRVGAGRLRGQLLYRIRIESPGGTAKVETVFSKQRALATAARVAALLGAEVDETTT